MSALEYIHATLALLMDPYSHDINDHQYILQHLQDVVHDSMERKWALVRKWTQFILDAVEKRKLVWSDTQLIQNERVRIAMTGAGVNKNNTGGPSSVANKNGSHTHTQDELTSLQLHSEKSLCIVITDLNQSGGIITFLLLL